MNRPSRVPAREWRLREHFGMTLMVTAVILIVLFVAMSAMPAEVVGLAAVLAVPHRHLHPRHARRRAEWLAAALSRVVAACRAQWPSALAVLASVDVVLGALVLVCTGHHLIAMGLLYGSLLAALAWVAWLLSGGS
jgi:hypothetical protein